MNEEMSLSQAQNIFMTANINSIVIFATAVRHRKFKFNS